MGYQLHQDDAEYFRFGRCLGNNHFHRSVELIYCIRTDKPITVGGEERVLHEGELLFVPPLVAHRYPPVEDHRALCVVMPVRYSDILEKQLDGHALADTVVSDREVAADCFAHMCMLENAAPLLREGLYTYILARCLAVLPLCPLPKKEETDFAVSVLVYIEKHYREKLSSAATARALGYSPCHFSTLFARNFKCAFPDYLNRVRIDKARSLLAGMTAAEAASAVGFQTAQSFYGNFKKITGKTPGEYRKTQGKA